MPRAYTTKSQRSGSAAIYTARDVASSTGAAPRETAPMGSAQVGGVQVGGLPAGGTDAASVVASPWAAGSRPAQALLGAVYVLAVTTSRWAPWRLRYARPFAIALLAMLCCTEYATGAERTELRRVIRAARAGDSQAQFTIGRLYLHGEPDAIQRAKGIRWIESAAEQGHRQACIYMGNLYVKGEGVTKDPVRALHWFNLANELGGPAVTEAEPESFQPPTQPPTPGAEAAGPEITETPGLQRRPQQPAKELEIKTRTSMPALHPPLLTLPGVVDEGGKNDTEPMNGGPVEGGVGAAGRAAKGESLRPRQGKSASTTRAGTPHGMSRRRPTYATAASTCEEPEGSSVPTPGAAGTPGTPGAGEGARTQGRSGESGARRRSALAAQVPDQVATMVASPDGSIRYNEVDSAGREVASDTTAAASNAMGLMKLLLLAVAVLLLVGLQVAIVALIWRMGRRSETSIVNLEQKVDVECVRQRAELGDMDAQYSLGVKYHHGHGLPRDLMSAIRWYRKAADQGHLEAQIRLAFAYSKCAQIPDNMEIAQDWYKKAASQGSERARQALLEMIESDREDSTVVHLA